MEFLGSIWAASHLFRRGIRRATRHGLISPGSVCSGNDFPYATVNQQHRLDRDGALCGLLRGQGRKPRSLAACLMTKPRILAHNDLLGLSSTPPKCSRTRFSSGLRFYVIG